MESVSKYKKYFMHNGVFWGNHSQRTVTVKSTNYILAKEICAFLLLHIHECIYTYILTYVYIHKYAYIHKYIYIYTHT